MSKEKGKVQGSPGRRGKSDYCFNSNVAREQFSKPSQGVEPENRDARNSKAVIPVATTPRISASGSHQGEGNKIKTLWVPHCFSGRWSCQGGRMEGGGSNGKRS